MAGSKDEENKIVNDGGVADNNNVVQMTTSFMQITQNLIEKQIEGTPIR